MIEVIRVYQHHNNQLASMVRVKCDTDFVARNEEFLEFVDKMAMGIAALRDFNFYDGIHGLYYLTNSVTDQTFMEDILDARKKFGEDIRLVTHSKFEVYTDESKDEPDKRG